MQPSIPVSILLAKEIRDEVLGQIIEDVQVNCFYEGKYKLDTVSFEKIQELAGQRIVKADANFLYTEKGFVVEFGYDNGGICLFDRDKGPPVMQKKPKTGGFSIIFVFQKVCLMISVNSWTCRFKIHPDSKQITRFPIDITSPMDFTMNRFWEWIDSRGNITILDACATSKGAFDVYISFMNYILWLCGIHPKSKVKKLSSKEIKDIYDTLQRVIEEYKKGTRICSYRNLWGQQVEENDSALSLMTAKNYHKPCPRCGTLIESVTGSGTKYYFCPTCQKVV